MFRTSRNRCFYGERTWVMRPYAHQEFWKRCSRLVAFMKLCHNLTVKRDRGSSQRGHTRHIVPVTLGTWANRHESASVVHLWFICGGSRHNSKNRVRSYVARDHGVLIIMMEVFIVFPSARSEKKRGVRLIPIKGAP